MKNISCIILAGGKSSRMGTDKAELVWQGKRFLEWQIEKAKTLGIADVLISGYRGKMSCGYSVIPDIFPERGPLGGMHACLQAAKKETCLVVSVDTPQLPVEVLQRLIQAHDMTKEATILTHNGKWEPLIGVYQSSVAQKIEPLISTRSAAVKKLLEGLSVNWWEYSKIEAESWNCNTPKDYENMQK